MIVTYVNPSDARTCTSLTVPMTDPANAAGAMTERTAKGPVTLIRNMPFTLPCIVVADVRRLVDPHRLFVHVKALELEFRSP